jgi:hypothetical protein
MVTDLRLCVHFDLNSTKRVSGRKLGSLQLNRDERARQNF